MLSNENKKCTYTNIFMAWPNLKKNYSKNKIEFVDKPTSNRPTSKTFLYQKPTLKITYRETLNTPTLFEKKNSL